MLGGRGQRGHLAQGVEHRITEPKPPRDLTVLREPPGRSFGNEIVVKEDGDLLSALDGRGLRIGVFSDYPATDKLEAMGLRGKVSLELDATAESVNAFKPHPRGLEVACQRWNLLPGDVL